MTAVLDFLQRLLRTPAMPGEEGELAELVAEEMRGLGYDEVRLDEAGNVLGRIEGRDAAPAVMFNTHLDHVDAGDPEAWPHPPFGGEVHGARVWGRGAVDIKGPLAAQVYGAARLLAENERPPGDVWVTAVVQEEVGGLGAHHLLTHLRPPLAVVGEPSGNELRRGHRGRVELEVEIGGRSVHASAPAAGVNPLYALARFLLELEELELPEDAELGVSTLAPTLLSTDQRSANVVPSLARLVCDCRIVPGQGGEDVRALLADRLERCLIPGATGEARVPVATMTSWTGLTMEIPAEHPAFLLSAGHPAVAAARRVLAPALGAEPPVEVWKFATDGGHFAAAGCTVIGFGPGEEELAHTARESIEVAELERAVEGNAALARAWPAAVAGA